ncbi:Putative teichuronic acid biosynthesis glycosyltransferase TuaG [Kordia antarctica]|uniref:Teichuronic acid biosynthesis glycosyltransferase TuaG n=1 Tax=Kordia antarctica TaxID=1218801 RepID=A0A7L4ZL47_9FLAO|nr:glycosyltransferase family 2 protein [Kordia antarctica]QHI37443.1 Putative teichuronic acid biosynthesis glycosyltransferase TuaG [Kordia antarctica]
MQQPLVSVITPTYNSEVFISETIDSIRAQTYTNWELILVDDASSDTTVEILQHYSTLDKRITFYVLDTNSGAAIARNTAIEKASGSFIAFLDADDLWKPEKLSKQISFMQTKDIAVSFSSYELMNEKGTSLGKMIKALPTVNYAKMLKSNYVGNLTGMYNAEKLGKVYMPNIRKRQDWALWLKLIKKVGKAHSLEEPLAKYRVRDNSISSNKINLLKYNYAIYRKALKFGAFKSSLYLVRFLIEHFFIKPQQTTQL